jgi:hypothetical protein
MRNIVPFFIFQCSLFSSVLGAAYFLISVRAFIICVVFIMNRAYEQTSILLQTTEKCFTVEQPRDTPLVFEYEIVDSTHIVGFDLFYGTEAVSELRIKHQVLDTAKGFTFVNYIHDEANRECKGKKQAINLYEFI